MERSLVSGARPGIGTEQKIRGHQGGGLDIKCVEHRGSRCLDLLQTLGIALFLLVCLSLQSLEAFTIISNAGKPARWADGEVSYKLYNVPAEFHSAIDSSFGVWSSVSGTSLSITNAGVTASEPDSRDGTNTVSWITGNWRNLSFRPPSNALAVTLSSFSSSSGLVVDADIYFNAEYFDWKNVNPNDPDDSDYVDVANIGTHEVGHLLGLDHSSEDFFETDDDLYNATMFYASGTGETSRRDPKSDDRHGIRSLYPSTTQEVARITSVELVQQTGSYYVYRIAGENFGAQTSFVISTGDTSELDRVSRYKTILSDTLAEVEFYLNGFDDTEPYLIAMNDVAALSSVKISIFADGENTASSSSELSSSGGGGGGCQSKAKDSPSAWILLLMSLALALGFRRRSLQASRI